jgi:hypothetical protein
MIAGIKKRLTEVEATNRGPRAGDTASILFVVAIALVLSLPMLLYGPLADAHDAAQHLHLTRHFTEQFWNGDLYPRWLVDMNHGLGSPTYFVFPPLPAYVSALLDPVGRALHFNAFNFATFLALLASGICAFLLLRNSVGPTEAAVGAVLYMAMPYHLLIDFYRRHAVSESWALAWMPLVLYFLPGAIAGKRRAGIGLAVSYALLIFSHLISVVMFSAIPLALALVLAPVGARIRAISRVAIAMALGIGISSVYLFPALAEAKYISAARFISLWMRSTGANGVLSFGKGIASGHGDSERHRFLQLISWADLSIIALGAICVFAMRRDLWGDSRRGSRRLIVFWTGVCCFAVFMTSRLSSPIWRDFHRLHQAIQHPWRFSALLCVGVLGLLAVLFSEHPWHLLVGDVRLRIVLSLVFFFWLLGYGYVWWRYKIAVPPAPDARSLVLDHDMLFWAWSPPGMDPRLGLQTALLASAGPKVGFREGIGTAAMTLWNPREIELETNSSAGGRVMVTQFHYPTWTATMKDSGTPVEVRTALPEGLLEVQVPPGIQHVRLVIPVSRAERVGGWLSAFCVLFSLAVGFSKERDGSSIGPPPEAVEAPKMA